MLSQLTKPTVSILVAARNEERNILDLLVSVSALNYPVDKLEVLIGDDDSTDLTAEIVRDFIRDKPHMQLHAIVPSSTHLQGKANVLAQLAKRATGVYLFFTDADITLPPTWIECTLENFQSNTGVVVGSTVTSPVSLFARCQGIEWLTVLNFMEICGRLNIPTTGMGNNMATTRSAYEGVGGYESIPFSIVEDYALYKAIIRKRFGFRHLFDKQILTFTKPPENYLSQRKRWISGGVKSKSPLILLALFQALLFPVILLLLLINPPFAMGLFGTVFFTNILLGGIALQKIKLTEWLPYLPFYALYVSIFWFLQLVNYLLPGSIRWKNRSY